MERNRIQELEAEVAQLRAQLRHRDRMLARKDRRIAELERQIQQLKHADSDRPRSLPLLIKPAVERGRGKKPGRGEGHAAALRPVPKIDRHEQVDLPKDRFKREICPHCRCPLQSLRRHRRIVEEIIPSSAEAICYHTRSGYCSRCHKRIESRGADQPPAANVRHGQLGLNALATAAILRVRHRLPFRQIAQLLLDLPGLSVSPAGIVKQIKRLARVLDGRYEQLIERMRKSPHVHVDETGWRIDGRNAWLWAFTDPTFTLYHVDASRGTKVPARLLGEKFNGTVICDFYNAYAQVPGIKQRCLVHLIREVKQESERWPGFADTPLARKLLRWCRDALLLKKRWDQLPEREYQSKASRLEDRLDALMLAEQHENVSATRIAKRLRRHRTELTRFLWDQKLEGTNNPAERAIRPAVVMRKITGGNRSQAGAIAWAKLASLVRSADQQELGVYEETKKLIRDCWATGR